MNKIAPAYFGIDIGTTTVRVVVGVVGDDQTLPTIVGAGSAPNQGMRKGTVINVDEVANAINVAVEEAERISGQRSQTATIAVNGSHIIGLNSKGVIAISSNNREISLEDLARVEEAATVVQLPPNREILQVFAKSYSLDGQENIKEPIGMSGVRLEVDAHIVTAATPAVKNLDRTLEVAGIGINHHILAGLAASEAVLEQKQRESGTVVVDFGAGTTNVIVYEEDDVQHVAVLPVGSVNLTNDLAIGLRTDLEIAEEVKLNHSSAVGTDAKNNKHIELTNGDKTHTFERRDVDDIVAARLDELFDLVDKELKKINRSGKLPGGAVLTGGGSLLPDIEEYVKKKLKLPAKVVKPKNYSGVIDTTDTPIYATAVGLMMLDMRLAGFKSGNSGGVNSASMTQSFKNFIQRFKP